MNLLFISLGGLVGMSIRFILSKKFSKIHYFNAITITMIINIISCFIIGVLLSSNLSSLYFVLFFQSFLSAFSTYSTFNYELIKNINVNNINVIMYFITTLFFSFLAFYIGIKI